MQQKRILLVAGCPRSGTTALVRLLNTHPEVAIGVERFTRRLLDEGRLERDLFEAKRFTTFEPGDGNRVSFESRATQTAVTKAETATVIGDKSPNSREVFEAAKSMGDVWVLAILRDPTAIARSYRVRASRARRDPEAARYWPASRGVRHAIKDFNTSVRETLELSEALQKDPALAQRLRFKVLAYETLFADPKCAAALFEFLGLDARKAEGLTGLYKESARLSAKSVNTPVLEFLVKLGVNWSTYERAMKLAD